ncbi:MAG: cell division protein FtsL [Candidatus Edwardsbacteria bacterium]
MRRVLLVILLVSFLLLVHVWEHHTVALQTQRVKELTKKKQTLIEENIRLQLQKNFLSRRERITKIAQEVLKMKYPNQKGEIIWIKENEPQ